MPEWVIVGEDQAGEPVVLVGWISTWRVAPIAAVKAGEVEPAVFRDRWRAKRLLRLRNEWSGYRCVKRSRL